VTSFCKPDRYGDLSWLEQSGPEDSLIGFILCGYVTLQLVDISVSMKIWNCVFFLGNTVRLMIHFRAVIIITFYFLNFFFCREEANLASSAFYLRSEKDDQKIILEDKDLEVLGTPIIKYGDSTVIVQHVDSSLWLSYKVLIFVNSLMGIL